MTFLTADLLTAVTAGTIFAFFAGTGSATHVYNKTIINTSLSTFVELQRGYCDRRKVIFDYRAA